MPRHSSNCNTVFTDATLRRMTAKGKSQCKHPSNNPWNEKYLPYRSRASYRSPAPAGLPRERGPEQKAEPRCFGPALLRFGSAPAQEGSASLCWKGNRNLGSPDWERENLQSFPPPPPHLGHHVPSKKCSAVIQVEGGRMPVAKQLASGLGVQQAECLFLAK